MPQSTSVIRPGKNSNLPVAQIQWAQDNGTPEHEKRYGGQLRANGSAIALGKVDLRREIEQNTLWYPVAAAVRLVAGWRRSRLSSVSRGGPPRGTFRSYARPHLYKRPRQWMSAATLNSVTRSRNRLQS